MSFNFRSLSLSLVLLAVQLVAQDPACSLSISGVVFDEHDRSPLSHAEIFLPELLKGALSDEHGRYVLSGLCPGTYVIRVHHLGCEPVERKVTIDKDLVLNFKLEHHHEELRELEVVRSRPDENVGMAQATVDRAGMDRAMGPTLPEVIAGVPGVRMLGTGPTIGKPVIHGLSGNRVLTLNQGVRQEDQQWGGEHAPSLDPFVSDRVTVVKGAASVQYGSDALGGVIIMEPADLPREGGLAGEFTGLGLYNGRGGGARGMLQGGVRSMRGLGWRVQGSARRMGDSEAPDYILSNTGLREAGASAAVGLNRHWGSLNIQYSWFARELGILRAAHIGNLTDLQNAIASGEPWYQAPFTYAIDAPRQVVQHHLLKAGASYRISDRDQVVLTYGYQGNDRQEYDIRRGGRSERPSMDLFLATHSGDAVLKHWLGQRLHGKIGVNGSLQENANIPGTGVRPLLPDYDRQQIGAFVLEHFPLTERLELEGGARIERTELQVRKWDLQDGYITPGHSFVNHAFSVGANWSWRDSLVLRANISSAFRPPHVSELYSEGLHHGAAAIEEGDATLGSERMWKATLDLDGSGAGGRLLAQATFHAARIADYIYLRPEGYRLTIRGAFPVFRYVSTDADIYGLDARVEYRFAPAWAWRVVTSMVRGWDRAQDQWVFLMPADRLENTLLFTPRAGHRLSGLELGLTSSVVAEQRRFPEGVDFTGPPPAYHLFGLNASMTIPLQRNELRFGIRASNLANTTYRDYLDRFRYYADARGLDVQLWVRYGFGHAR